MDDFTPPALSRSISDESVTFYCTDALSSFEDDEDEIFDGDVSFFPIDEHIKASMNPQLFRDMESLIFLYGEKSISYRVFESLDEIDVELHIPMGFLDEVTADKWKVLRTEPLVTRLYLSLSQYLGSSNPPKVEVFQPSKKEGFGFGSRVRKFLENFLSSEWHNLHRDYQKHLEEMRTSQSAQENIRAEALVSDSVSEIVRDEDDLIPLPTLDGRNVVPSIADGFLIQVFRYLRQGIPTMNESCIICDAPHVPQNGAILKPAVCDRELCQFALMTLGVMADAADDIATGAEVVDFLITMTRAAAFSNRNHIIFDPFPTVVDPDDPCNLLFTPKYRDYNLVKKVLQEIPSMSDMACMTSSLKQKLDQSNRSVYPLIQWIITSNRSHIVKLPPERRLEFMHTPHQFLLVTSPPAKEAAFQEAKRRHGSTFAFHESSIENWHSIIRQGFMIESGTMLEVNGAAYGKGVYLSPHISTSMKCSRMGYGSHSVKKNKFKPDTKTRFITSSNITCIAICEVITSPLKKYNSVWVCPEPDNVCTRFFFVYEDGQVGDSSIDTQDSKFLKQIQEACGYKV